MIFLRGRQRTYLKRFLRRYLPNNARLSRRRASLKLVGSDPALLRWFTCCTRIDHLLVFPEYNIHNPRARLNNSKRSVRLVDAHNMIHWYPKSSPESFNSFVTSRYSNASIHVTEWRCRHSEWEWLITYLMRPLSMTVHNPTIVPSIFPVVCYRAGYLVKFELNLRENSTYLPKWRTRTSDRMIGLKRRSRNI